MRTGSFLDRAHGTEAARKPGEERPPTSTCLRGFCRAEGTQAGEDAGLAPDAAVALAERAVAHAVVAVLDPPARPEGAPEARGVGDHHVCSRGLWGGGFTEPMSGLA